MRTFLARDGQTLLLVLMVMLVLLLLSLTLGTLIQHQNQNVFKEEYFLRALNAAEAGIETTIASITGEGKASWYDDFPLAGENGDFISVFTETVLDSQVSYEVSAQKHEQEIGTSMYVNSVGRYRTGDSELAAQKTLQSEIGVYEAGDYLRGLTMLPGEPASIELDSNLVLNGDLLINGEISITCSTEINGVVYVSGNVAGTWSGEIREGYSFIPPFPELDEENYFINATEYGEVYAFDTSFDDYYSGGEPGDEDTGSVTEYNSIYFVDGDITIGGNYRGTALFFATGSITVAGDLIPEPGAGELPDTGAGMLALVALDDVNIQNHAVYANILAGGSLRALGGAALYGSACVTGVDFDEGEYTDVIYIRHQENLAPLEDFIPVKTKIVEWKELYPVF